MIKSTLLSALVFTSGILFTYGAKVEYGKPELNGFNDPERGKTGDKGDIIIPGAFAPKQRETTLLEFITVLEVLSKECDPKNEGVLIRVDNNIFGAGILDGLNAESAMNLKMDEPGEVELMNAPISILLYCFSRLYFAQCGFYTDVVESVDKKGIHTLTVQRRKE